MPIPGVSLVGFMNRSSAIGYLRHVCFFPGRSDAALKQIWQQAHAQLGQAVGLPGQAAMLDMPPTAAPHTAAVQAHPRFTETCGGMPHEFKLVEISALLAFQFHVLDNAVAFCDPADGIPDVQRLLDLCLPLDAETPPALSGMTEIPNGFAIRSPDMNAAPLEYIPGADHLGRPVAGIRIGQRSRFVQVVRFRGLCYLKNGYHRARAARVAGATHMPAVVLDATRFDQVGAVGGVMFDQGVLTRQNPPTCEHFVDGRAYALPIRRHGLVIEVRLNPHGEALE